MSDVMLQGVLCMPPELWRDSPLDVNQRYQRYLQASRRIDNDALEIEYLRTALRKIRDCETLESAKDIALKARTVPNAKVSEGENGK